MTNFNFSTQALNLYSNAFVALYEIGKNCTIEKRNIATAQKAVKNALNNVVMATTLTALKERKTVLKCAQEDLATAEEALRSLNALQETILNACHAELDHAEVWEAYQAYAKDSTFANRRAYILAFAKTVMPEEDLATMPTELIAEYMYFGKSKANAYRTKTVTKADGKTKFYDMLLRCVVDRLIAEGLIDISKLEFDERKRTKLEAKARAKVQAEAEAVEVVAEAEAVEVVAEAKVGGITKMSK